MSVRFGHFLLTIWIVIVVVIAACVSPAKENSPTETTSTATSVNTHHYELNGTHLINFTVTLNGTTFGPYVLEGMAGGDVFVPEGVLLYAYYPGELSKPTEFLLVGKSGGVVWRKRFSGLTEFWASTEGRGIFIKQGSQNPRINPVLYLINMKTGEIILSRELPGGGTVGDIVLKDGLIYLTTSGGYVHMVGDKEMESSYFDSIGGTLVNFRLHLAVGDEYLAVAYWFANETNEKSGLCVFTTELERIACRRLEKRPSGVSIEGNTVYVISGGESFPYRIDALAEETERRNS